MSEQLAKLKATIKDLEAELTSLTAVDAETRGLLEEAVNEIESVIHKHEHTRLASATLAEKLRSGAEQFETSHPNLFGIVTRIIDGLGQIGI